MKIRFFNKFIILLILSKITNPLHTNEELTPSSQFHIILSTSYIDRGDDIFENQFHQNKKYIGSFNFAPVIQTNLSVRISESLFFDFGTYHAIKYREDKDIDELFQLAPEDHYSTVSTSYLNLFLNNILNRNNEPKEQLYDFNNPQIYLVYKKNLPNFYKEPVGLKHFDQYDLGLKNSFQWSYGVFSIGILNSYFPNYNIDKYTKTSTECFVEFIPNDLPNMMMSVYKEIVESNSGGIQIQYTFLLMEERTFSLSLKPSIGYEFQNNFSSLKYVDLTFSIFVKNFTFSAVGVYRPDLRFYDNDLIANRTILLFGGSTNKDQIITDPAKTYGLLNAMINSYISQTIQSSFIASGSPIFYRYTPRQKIPKYKYYVSMGYLMSF